VTNPENNPCIQTAIRIATKLNYLFTADPLPIFPENCMQIGSEAFLRKVANRQTDRQTNDDENITSLAKVIYINAAINVFLQHLFYFTLHVFYFTLHVRGA